MTMDVDRNIFYSEITRVNTEQRNSLQDLLDVTPAEPISNQRSENGSCFFEPRSDKCFIPKKGSRLKVRTVREIRNQFEQDNYNFIIEDMEKQQSVLLTKIRNGSATDNTTKTLAKKLLNADHPISRTAWQMLNNINPDRNVNPTQLVLWNGRRVRVVGSKGGRNKFICNYDLGSNDAKKTNGLKVSMKKQHGLLSNSYNIKFRPGPLQKKKYLDRSYQKYQMGPTKLVELPKPALDIQPAYGANVELVMANLLNKLRPDDGTITDKWAELAVTVLGTIENNSPVQMHENCCVTFELNYKCDQNRILMRQGLVDNNDLKSDICPVPNALPQKEKDNMPEIKNIVNKMLDCVEISLNQDKMYSEEIELSQTILEPFNNPDVNNTKEKNKKKFCELDRLAVTVIQLPGAPTTNQSESCVKSYCHLGCICDSLNCTRPYKQHCGFTKCMFECKCDFSSNRGVELMKNDCVELMPDLIELDEEINAKLAKEEQKFHQTVIVSGKKSILLKSRKRHLKCSERYAEFYSNMRLQNKQEPQKKILTIVERKLNCTNVETWCMVHNLYKCFCRGRFTHTSVFDTSASMPASNIPVSIRNFKDITTVKSTESSFRNVLRPRVRHSRESTEKKCCLVNDNSDVEIIDTISSICARTNEFIGRKHSENYYKVTNYKILEMEKNDTQLQNKMLRLIKNNISQNTLTPATSLNCHEVGTSENLANNKNKLINPQPHRAAKTDKLIKNVNNKTLNKTKTNKVEDQKTVEANQNLPDKEKMYQLHDTEDTNAALNIPFEISGDIYKPIEDNGIPQEFLTPWIAKSYKQFMRQQKTGKSILERPKRGSIILHLWESLLSRYKSQRNLFLTTRRRPFRIYIATESWKPFFKDCININSIRFADLNKYPILVKKLLTNESNKDYFCILGGWDDCWEIIGSVKKNDSSTDDRSCDSDISNNDNDSLSRDSNFPENWCIKEDNDQLNSPIAESLQKNNKNISDNRNFERSKWFLIKLENDFSEIYCHKKGFYVERQKILHAINLARVTRKTVVINKQAYSEIVNIPFGIYALPYTNEYCAVVGPYEINEQLGLEIVKKNSDTEIKNTKGFWITANKVDNMKVLDDPMSFLPTNTEQSEPCKRDKPETNLEISDKEATEPSTSNDKNIVQTKNQDSSNDETKEKVLKIVKPIKIRRTNGFYHLTSNNQVVKKTTTTLTKTKRLRAETQISETNDPKILNVVGNFSEIQNVNSNHSKKTPDLCIESYNDIEIPQIKITSVYSENVSEIEKNKTNDKKTCMFILKPEEINKKLAEKNNAMEDEGSVEEKLITGDIENFLSSQDENLACVNDVCLISDDEDEIVNNDSDLWTDVWIQCSNVQNLGWIRGREFDDKLFDIEFPSFDSCHMYSRDETFEKINQILSSKCIIPEDFQLKWEVLTFSQAVKRLKGKRKLNIEQLTQKSARNEEISEVTNSSMNSPQPSTSHQVECSPNDNVRKKTSDLIDGLEHTSRLLEDENVLLWRQTKEKQAEIFQTLIVPDELRAEMSDTLDGLKAMNDDLNKDCDLTAAVTEQDNNEC